MRRAPLATRFPVLAFAAALLAGLLQAASIASPADGQPLWWLQVASLAALAFALDREPRAGRAFFLGWLFATSWLCGTFWWLFVSLHTYGGLPAVLAVTAVLALAAFLALYYALACAAFVRFAPTNRWGRGILFASLWLLAELLRGHWFTGFPWGAGGYAHVEGPLATLAPWGGVYGIGVVAALISFLLADGLVLVFDRSRRLGQGGVAAAVAPAAVAVLLLVGLAALAHLAPADEPQAVTPGAAPRAPLTVALLQGNIPQDEKFQPGSGVPLALRWYAEQLRDATASLVVAPETAVPLLPAALPPGYWDSIAQHFAGGASAALIGMPLGGFTEGYANAVVGLKPGVAGLPAPVPYRYDKHHLVPFGEFVPPLFRWFTDLMQIPLGDFRRGGLGQPVFEWQGQRLMPNICYEDLFGEEIAASFAPGRQAPTMLVNVSNIGWFGDTIAIDQHLAISRMRTLEFARPMLRATNTGATAIIDHRGRVTDLFPRHVRGVLVGEVQGRDGITPYAAWASRYALWPLWMLGLLPLLLAVAVRFGRRAT
jgi:apolipoprotein N-acyltransferase